MGKLYAEQIIIGDWLFSIENLVAALPRGWIFQEIAFCELDAKAVQHFTGILRKLGLAARESLAALETFLSACALVSTLLGRRAGFNKDYMENKLFPKIPKARVIAPTAVRLVGREAPLKLDPKSAPQAT